MSMEEKEQKKIALEKENQALPERIAELERRLGIDSKNSPKPSSSDGLNKKNHRTKSLRAKSQRKTAQSNRTSSRSQTMPSRVP